MRKLTLIACAAMFCLGCDDGQSEPAAATPPSSPTAAEQPPATPPANDYANAQIAYDTRIETKDGKSTVYWTATVPTGGWTMQTDQPPLVEESNTLWWARVYVTLTAPGPNDAVTQAVETLEGKYEADRKIDRVEFSVRRKVKGVEPAFAPLYQVVKTGAHFVTDADKAGEK